MAKQFILHLLHHGDTMNQVNFLERIAYIEFKYPSCMVLPEAESTTCTDLDWINAGKGFESNYRCTSGSNVLKIDNLNGNYPDNNSTQMNFDVKLSNKHNCGNLDYVNVTMKEDIGNKDLETGGVISILIFSCLGSLL